MIFFATGLFTLAIERGKYTKPKTEISKRLRSVWNLIED